MPVIREHALDRSTVYTDEWTGFRKLGEQSYQHERIHHAEKIYVAGDVHANTIEGFWSLVKRGIGGVYHSVSKKYLQAYLDEYAFRYNHRTDARPIFRSLLENASSGQADQLASE